MELKDIQRLVELSKYETETEKDTNEYNELYDRFIEMLKNNELVINFTKVNGDERIMPCTRNNTYISRYYNGEKKETEQNEDDYKKNRDKALVKVFDTEKKAFRSFHVYNLNSYSIRRDFKRLYKEVK